MFIDSQLIPTSQLNALITDFILQNIGVDNDVEIDEQTLANHVQTVKQQLIKKILVISFSEHEESIGILATENLGLKPSEVTF